jgi:hypothetical protein
MISDLNRSYRKNITSHGLIYLGGQELSITVKDLSITGILAHLKCSNDECDKFDCDHENRDAKDIFNMLSGSALLDFFLPEMHLAGEAEVVRVDIFKENILLALEFKNISYDIDSHLYKRKTYRKTMAAPGKILLGGEYHEFVTVNVSVEGLMINIADSIVVEPGEITLFEFDSLDLKGEIKVVWVEHITDSGIMLGLQYEHMEKIVIKGIPRFAL